MAERQITNATVYLKSLSETDRQTLQTQIESKALSWLATQAPGTEIIVDNMCGLLDFNLAHRRILNGLLKRLSDVRFGKLILGRKGHPTKFVVWDPSGFTVKLPVDVVYPTVEEAYAATKQRLSSLLDLYDSFIPRLSKY